MQQYSLDFQVQVQLQLRGNSKVLKYKYITGKIMSKVLKYKYFPSSYDKSLVIQVQNNMLRIFFDTNRRSEGEQSTIT